MFQTMIAEELKTAVDTLSPKERHELSCYLTKLELQSDPDYWKTIRERTNSVKAKQYVPVPKNQEKL
ncbi:MAG: hypothetical protein V4727_06305 [Verrucomicrobiota bacterium]